MGTQTPGAKKIIKNTDISVQADGDKMRLIIVKSRMMAYHILDINVHFPKYKSEKQKLLVFKNINPK